MTTTYRFDNIPNELKAQKRWVCWEADKTPVQPSRGGKPAQSNHPETWTDFNAAVECTDIYAGIGFMLGDGYIGVDLDDIEDDLTAYRAGNKNNRVFEFVSTLNSYAEVSPSGKGLHIICKGTFPPGGKRKGKVEMYDGGRFFTVTGNAVTNCREIADCTESIKALHEKYIGKPQPRTVGDYTPIGGMTASDDEIVRMAQNASNGAEFMRLYNGDAGKDHSAADLALCNFLAYWTGKDASRMDSIFRTSGLMRKKWNEKHGADTYGNMTIRKAIESVRDVYKSYSITIGG
jgi:putative DNA primase/helicase